LSTIDADTVGEADAWGFAGPEDVRERLAEGGYLADEALATSVYLAAAVQQPLLLEGEAGVGKTEVARALAETTGARLVRLQCYEGIDVHQAVYDWNYSRQLLALRRVETDEDEDALFSARYLIRRPLLEAIEHDERTVLLIDEIDRADEAFEAFLLELLSDFAVTIPELGTIRAAQRPIVVLTSNRTRELHDALKRRCLYQWIDYPDLEREVAIVRSRLPEAPDAIAERVCRAVARMRGEELYKAPGIGETIAWARSLLALGPEVDLTRSVGAVLKVREDVEHVLRSHLLDGA
jgi:MoxR-like ATPase